MTIMAMATIYLPHKDGDYRGHDEDYDQQVVELA